MCAFAEVTAGVTVPREGDVQPQATPRPRPVVAAVTGTHRSPTVTPVQAVDPISRTELPHVWVNADRIGGASWSMEARALDAYPWRFARRGVLAYAGTTIARGRRA